MYIAAAVPESFTPLTKRPTVTSIKRRKGKALVPPHRTWARYKPPPRWTAFVAFLVAIAIHVGAIALVDPNRDEHLARLWENYSPKLEEALPELRRD